MGSHIEPVALGLIWHYSALIQTIPAWLLGANPLHFYGDFVPQIDPPPEFLAALQALRITPRPAGLAVQEVPAPPRLAPFSVAIKVHTDTPEDEIPSATSTLVVLYDPSQRDIWGGDFRVVGHLRAHIDQEMSNDPILGEFLWTALLDRLNNEVDDFSGVLGTVTRELSQTFGGLTLRGSTLNVELRCSWSTDDTNLDQHLFAWCKYVLESAGLPSDLPHGLEVRSNA